jgi:hypothetical protein
MTLLRDLDAFFLDHRCCGDLRAGFEEREDERVVWIESQCSATIVQPLADDDRAM